MKLVVTIDVPEDKIDHAILKKIDDLENEISHLTQESRRYENLCREIVKIQFPQLWFGGRNGMDIEELLKDLSLNKVNG